MRPDEQLEPLQMSEQPTFTIHPVPLSNKPEQVDLTAQGDGEAKYFRLWHCPNGILDQQAVTVMVLSREAAKRLAELILSDPEQPQMYVPSEGAD